MGKHKTNKSTLKRLKITGGNKILRRSVGQNHFNAKDSGNEKRGKRKFKGLPKEFQKGIKQIIN